MINNIHINVKITLLIMINLIGKANRLNIDQKFLKVGEWIPLFGC
jgi:hypothetical protein